MAKYRNVNLTRVSVDGLKDLDAALSQLQRTVAKTVLRRVARRALEPMRAEAQRLAPDDPNTPNPDLESSIIISSRQKSGRQGRRSAEEKRSVVVYMGPSPEGYPQAVMQEFGTVHHPPQPYMRPAFDSEKDGALEIIKADLGSEIQKTVQRQARKAARLAAKG